MKVSSPPTVIHIKNVFNFFFDIYFQVSCSLTLEFVSALVLDEDGTDVDTEEFFQTLPENSVLMVLEKGQKWTPHPVSV